MKSDRSATATAPATDAPAPKAKSETVKPTKGSDLRTVSNAPSRGPMSLEATIGVKIRDLRRKLDVTATDLAQSAGLSAGMLSKIEHGGRTEPVWSHEHDALALADAINADLGTVQA